MTYKEPSATGSEPGLITLTNDLGGSATSPSVITLTGSAVNKIAGYPGATTTRGALWMGSTNVASPSNVNFTLSTDASANTYLGALGASNGNFFFYAAPGGTLTQLALWGGQSGDNLLLGAPATDQLNITPAGLSITTPTADTATNNITLTPQAPNGSATSHKTPGSVVVNAPLPISGGGEGTFQYQRNGQPYFTVQGLVGGPTSYAGIYLGPNLTPNTSNHCLVSDNTNVFVNSPGAGAVQLQVNGIVQENITSSSIAITPVSLSWVTGTTSPKLAQADNTTSSATATNLTVQAQNATGTTSVGGNLVLTSGTGTSTNGTVNVQAGGSTKLAVTPSQVQVTEQFLLQSIILNDGYSGATTTDGGTYTIYTEPAQATSTSYDYVVTVVGQEASDGDLYRADFSFNYQRIASAGPTVAGAAPTALNVRTTGDGSSWSAAISTAGNSVIVNVTGQVGNTVNWVVAFNRITCA